MFPLGILDRRRRRKTSRRGTRSHLLSGRRYGFESLEVRRLLSADASTGEALPPDEIGQETAQQFERFESAEQLQQFLIDDALKRYSHQFGQRAYSDWWYSRDMVMLAEPASVATANFQGNTHSDTNVQVAGVDEADIVETDGGYLYVVSGGELVIVDALPADQLRVTSRFDIDGYAVGIYLSGDRLTIISELRQQAWYGNVILSDAMFWEPREPDGPKVGVTVLDISDRESPVVVEETEFEGTYVDSRAVDDIVYVVTSNSFHLPGPLQLPTDGPWLEDHQLPPVSYRRITPELVISDTVELVTADTAELVVADRGRPIHYYPRHNYVYETQDEYLARIGDQVLHLALPEYSSFGPDGQVLATGYATDPTDVYLPLRPDDGSLVSVVVFDTGDATPGPVSAAGLPWGYTTDIYASTDSLYLHREIWDSFTGTSIVKFDVDRSTGHVELSAAGSVPGRLLNQFSLDEYNGYLRVATTTDWGMRSQNHVFVLEQNGLSLDIVGRLEDLAPGERIYSARFMGDVAFVVTFRQIDPLFTIDLSDPTDPQVLGELKIPGFSGYLQAVDENHLFGIGRDADPFTGRPLDLQISLFDVQDLSQPALLDRHTIDVFNGSAAWTEALTDHHAIGYYPEYQVLALPVRLPTYGGWPSPVRQHPSVTEMWVFHIDVGAEPASPANSFPGDAADADGISLLGRISHWNVKRSVRIENRLYLVSDNMISVHDILDPEPHLAQLRLDREYDWGTDVVSADVELRLVREPTQAEPSGQIEELPANEEWIDEWDSHWAEIWVRTSDDQHPVTGGTVDLAYQTDFFTATQLERGPSFVSEFTGEIDDVNGTVTGLGASTRLNHPSGEQWTLFARVKFEALGDDQLPAGDSSRPYEVGVRLTGADLTAVLVNQVDENLGDAPNTELRPVVYDVNDDNVVDFDDLELLTSVFQQDVIGSDAQLPWTLDFDRTGRVDLGDFSYLAANFQHRRGPGSGIRYDDRFGRRWVGSGLDIEGNVSVDEVFDAAVDAWQEALDLPEPIDVQLAVRDLPSGQLGEARVLEFDQDGLPRRACIVLDHTANGAGWHDGLTGRSAPARQDLLDALIGEIGKTLESSSVLVRLAAHAASQLRQNLVPAAGTGLGRGSFAAVTDLALEQLGREHPGTAPDQADNPLGSDLVPSTSAELADSAFAGT